jgi:predicted amino acid-binding ACT domain protein
MAATRYVLSVMCEDKVGVVARLARAVERLDGNIEELHQGVLQGYFVLTFAATFRGGPSAGAVQSALAGAGEAGEFVVSVLPRREAALPPAGEGQLFVLAVEGTDAPGILGKLTACLADRGVNIEDLDSRSAGGAFTITARLTVPPGQSVSALRLDLDEILAACAPTVTLMHEDIFNATSRVEMA